jgi:hypothetical protein
MSPLFVLRLSCFLLLTLVGCTSVVETLLLAPTATPTPISTSTPPRATPAPDPTLLPIYPIVTNTPTFTPQQVDERAIYAHLLNYPPYPFHPPTNVTRLSEWSLLWDLDHLVSYEQVQAAIPAITPAHWDEFRTINSVSHFVPHELPVWESYGWLNHKKLASIFMKGRSMQENWQQYYAEIGSSTGVARPEGGYMVFSQIKFLDKNRAFLVVRVECGLGCSRGFLYLFEQEVEEWKPVNETTLWEDGDWETAKQAVLENDVVEGGVEWGVALRGTPTPMAPRVVVPVTTPIPHPSVTPILPTATPIPQGDPQRAALEAEIYAVVYQTSDLHHVNERPLWVEDTTTPYNADDFDYLKSHAPTLTSDTWIDFYNLNQNTYRLSATIPFTKPYTFITDAEIETLWQRSNNGIFDGDVISFSRVGFNTEQNQALVYSSYFCGALCAGGYIHILEFQAGAWNLIAEVELWVS